MRKWLVLVGAIVTLEVFVWFHAFEFEQQYYRDINEIRYSYAAEKVAVRSLRLAGLMSHDCGFVAIGENPEETSRCAQRFFAQRKPFRAWYEVQGKDSIGIAGLAYNSDRELSMVILDFMGGADTDHAWFHCPAPQQLYVSYKDRLDCRPSYAAVDRSTAILSSS